LPFQEKDLFPDNYTRREILTQTLPCTVCGKQYGLSEIDDHMTTHDQSNLCYFQDVGCELEVLPGQLKEHLENEVQYHMRLLHAKVQPLAFKKEEVELWEAAKDSERENSLIRVLYEKVISLEQKSREQECQLQKYKRDFLNVEKRLEDVSLRHCFGEFLWKIDDFRAKVQVLVFFIGLN